DNGDCGERVELGRIGRKVAKAQVRRRGDGRPVGDIGKADPRDVLTCVYRNTVLLYLVNRRANSGQVFRIPFEREPLVDQCLAEVRRTKWIMRMVFLVRYEVFEADSLVAP